MNNDPTIEIDGQAYTIDVKRAKELSIIKPKYMPKKIGDKFISSVSNDIYVLAETHLIQLPH
jgi:hypothetical protein